MKWNGVHRRWRLVMILCLLLVTMTVTGEEQRSSGTPGAERIDVAAAPLENIRIGAADGRVFFSWSIARQFSGDFRGVRLYRVRDGRQIRYGQPTEELLEDLGLRTSWTVSSLENGEQYEFILKAYDSGKKEFWSSTLYAYPGTDPRGAPRMPASVSVVAGDGRIALFWERNREVDLALYEIQRKGSTDRDFLTIARIPKALRLNQERKPTARGPLMLSPAAYLDRTVTNGVTYQYRLRALDLERKGSLFTEPLPVQPHPATPPSGREVVLIVNADCGDANGNGINDSEEVARYYAEKRGVPENQIIRLHLKQDGAAVDYARDIQQPLRQFLRSGDLAGRVTMLVPCFGVPTWSGGLALDSRLSDLFDRFITGKTLGTANPYFDGDRHFDGTYGVYLVTRLDGPTVEIAKGLVDKALAAQKTVSALSGGSNLGTRGTRRGADLAIRKTAEFGRWLGVRVTMKDPGEFGEHEFGPDVFWYFAWYHQYRDPMKGEWPVGAVGAHLISNSFATIREKVPTRKSWVQGLLEKGITATFGAVVEPYEQGYTRPDIFFSHFWPGEYTFAESFFMATPTVQWAMSAVGDPLFRLKKPPVRGEDTVGSGREK
jgi:uncharacterized protein (TIGR03790 family)